MLKFIQTFFDFDGKHPAGEADSSTAAPLFPDASLEEGDDATPALSGKHPVEDMELTETCRSLLARLDLHGAGRLVRVHWNPRMRSTAGYASYPSWRIELNPRLREFEGQVDRTLRHELAHLIAYHRAGRRRIEPHGSEWRRACADLGIPDESARHRLPLPRREVEPKYTYVCPNCSVTAKRVRKFRRFTACRECCSKYGNGRYDGRFRFVLVEERRAASKSAKK